MAGVGFRGLLGPGVSHAEFAEEQRAAKGSEQSRRAKLSLSLSLSLSLYLRLLRAFAGLRELCVKNVEIEATTYFSNGAAGLTARLIAFPGVPGDLVRE
jgi:hypothetical protein